MRCDNEVVLISGAARGQGLADAQRLAAEGANVVLGDVSGDVQESAKEIGTQARGVHLDVTDSGSWERAVQYAEDEFGPITSLVNNAGIFFRQSLADLDVKDSAAMWDVNVLGVALGIQAVTTSMKRAGRGSIVNISSAAGMAGYPYSAMYCATKWAVRGITKTAMNELAADKIRVNSIHPGFIDTAMVTGDPEFSKLVDQLVLDHPIPRIGTTREVALAVVYFVSQESSFCTGTELVIDGGELSH